MSADNGIYVLLTESEKGPEYRVAYAFSIDNIYGEWNEDTLKYEGNIPSLTETFKESPVFYSLNEALDFAGEIEYGIGHTEDGICVISDFQSLGHIFG